MAGQVRPVGQRYDQFLNYRPDLACLPDLDLPGLAGSPGFPDRSPAFAIGLLSMSARDGLLQIRFVDIRSR